MGGAEGGKADGIQYRCTLWLPAVAWQLHWPSSGDVND